MDYERRAFDFEVRAEGDGKLSGHAAVFDEPTEIHGFQEVVRRGAFKKTIKESDVRALWNHNPDFVLGRNKSGTLELAEDKTGLAVEIDPPNTQWARDLLVSIERGDVSQMSFGFRAVREEWQNEDSDKESLRELLEVQLFDVSPVTFPAYPETDIAIRSLQTASAKCGLDAERLLEVLCERMPGELTDCDERTVKEWIQRLKSYLPPEAGMSAKEVAKLRWGYLTEAE